MHARIDCDLLTGFLGSGKTTLLNAWLRSPLSAGTAVVVNEVGDIGIDQLVLAQVADNVMLLASGCLCCTLSGSLRETLLDLYAAAEAQKSPLRRIVIETTGLAEPLPLLHSLLGDKILTDIIRLNQVIVTFDAQQGMRHLETQPESLRQLAAAECVVITKRDAADPAEFVHLRQAIGNVNPIAILRESVSGQNAEEIFTTSAGFLQRQAVVAAVSAAQTGTGGGSHEHSDLLHERVTTFSFYVDQPISWAGLSAWWHLVSTHYGDNLLRCKGLLRMCDATTPYVFIQTVGKVFHQPDPVRQWSDGDSRSRLVCIGVDLDTDWLRRSLAALRIDEPGLLPGNLAELAILIPSHSE